MARTALQQSRLWTENVQLEVVAEEPAGLTTGEREVMSLSALLREVLSEGRDDASLLPSAARQIDSGRSV